MDNAGVVKNHNDLSLEFMKLAREEVLERVKLRDQALLFYIGAIGAYLAFVIAKHFNPATGRELSYLLVAPLPLISWTFTLIILSHHDLISNITLYLEREMYFLEGKDVRFTRVPPWQVSTTYAQSSQRGWNLRFIAQAATLVLPSGYGLYFCLRELILEQNSIADLIICSVLIYLDVVFSVWTISLHWKSKKLRGSLLDVATLKALKAAT